MSVTESVRNVLQWRARQLGRHYQRLFTPDGAMSRDAEIVLADLKNACFADRSTWSDDPRQHARREGARQVWLRISRLLNLDDSQTENLMEIEYDTSE